MDMDQEGFADQHHPMNLVNNLDFFTFGGQYRSLQNKRLNLDGEILHQLIILAHYLQGFVHPRWCRISSTNSST